MIIDIFKRTACSVLVAGYLWLSISPLCISLDQQVAAKNEPVEASTQIVTVEAEPVVETRTVDEPKKVDTTCVETSDTYVISAYCGENYPHICNDGDASYTATGTVPTAGRTIAVDPRRIPYGTEVIIDGHTYIAEDCGGAIQGNRIDLFFNTHQEALAWGMRTKQVIIKK